MVYESHPGEDVSYGEKLVKKIYFYNSDINQKINGEKKYSVYADLGLGALFFIVGKILGDLVFATIFSQCSCKGLSPFFFNGLLGIPFETGQEFAVFGTIMLLLFRYFPSGIFLMYSESFLGTNERNLAFMSNNSIGIFLMGFLGKELTLVLGSECCYTRRSAPSFTTFAFAINSFVINILVL